MTTVINSYNTKSYDFKLKIRKFELFFLKIIQIPSADFFFGIVAEAKNEQNRQSEKPICRLPTFSIVTGLSKDEIIGRAVHLM
jgi:hypothetical protein